MVMSPEHSADDSSGDDEGDPTREVKYFSNFITNDGERIKKWYSM